MAPEQPEWTAPAWVKVTKGLLAALYLDPLFQAAGGERLWKRMWITV